jgi:hypothetical protein
MSTMLQGGAQTITDIWEGNWKDIEQSLVLTGISTPPRKTQTKFIAAHNL